MDPELNRNVGKMVIPQVFDPLLGIKPTNSCIALMLSQESGSQSIGIDFTQFHYFIDRRVSHSNRAYRATNILANYLKKCFYSGMN